MMNPADDEPDLDRLPVAEVLETLHSNPESRLYDLMESLPLAPQSLRLTVAVLIERGAIRQPADDGQRHPNTDQLRSSQLLQSAVAEFLGTARRAGLGTTNLPYLIVVDEGTLPELVTVLKNVPGFYLNPQLGAFVEQLEATGAGSLTLTSEAGKLSLHVQQTSSDALAKVEAAVAVVAGVLLWLSALDDREGIRTLIERLESVTSAASGLLVGRADSLAIGQRLITGTKRWQTTCHPPQTLLGIFRMLEPRPEDPG
jgi:hypothetical protein